MLAFRKVPNTFIRQSESQMNLCEDYSDNTMPQFAVLSPDGTQVGSWMKCKDFIQDTIWGSKNNVEYELYGWYFNPSESKISKRYLLLGIKWPSKSSDEMKECLANVKGTVENLEKRIGIPMFQRTRFSRILKGDTSHFVIYGSPAWMRCVGTVSFFTWLLRASLRNVGQTLESIANGDCPVNKDSYYLRTGEAFISQLLSHGIESFIPDWKSRKVESVHHNGFVNYAAHLKSKRPTFIPENETGRFHRGDLDADCYDEDDEYDGYDDHDEDEPEEEEDWNFV